MIPQPLNYGNKYAKCNLNEAFGFTGFLSKIYVLFYFYATGNAQRMLSFYKKNCQFSLWQWWNFVPTSTALHPHVKVGTR